MSHYYGILSLSENKTEIKQLCLWQGYTCVLTSKYILYSQATYRCGVQLVLNRQLHKRPLTDKELVLHKLDEIIQVLQYHQMTDLRTYTITYFCLNGKLDKLKFVIVYLTTTCHFPDGHKLYNFKNVR